MICLLPFTYIEEQDIARITGALGPIAVCGLIPDLLPGHMQPWIENKLLEPWYPESLKADQLGKALREFKSWADMHRGRIDDMVDFHKLQEGHPPLVDETQPTRIGYQVRHYGEEGGNENADPIFQAALFLAMAQEHDRQHEAVERDLGKVMAMEKTMLARLSGETGEGEADPPKISGSGSVTGPEDVGAYMTARRVQSWARLAGLEVRPYSIYVTTSPAVCEYILEMFPDAGEPLTFRTGAEGDGETSGAPGAGFYDALKAISMADDPTNPSPELSHYAQSDTTGSCLKLYPLTRVRPSLFLDKLSGTRDELSLAPASDKPPRHTLLGLLELS